MNIFRRVENWRRLRRTMDVRRSGGVADHGNSVELTSAETLPAGLSIGEQIAVFRRGDNDKRHGFSQHISC
jgi:hypothetical protein